MIRCASWIQNSQRAFPSTLLGLTEELARHFVDLRAADAALYEKSSEELHCGKLPSIRLNYLLGTRWDAVDVASRARPSVAATIAVWVLVLVGQAFMPH
jgi:hypothetical protein